MAAGERDTTALLASMTAESPPDRTSHLADPTVKEGPTTFFVVDGHELLSGRAAPTRRLLSGHFGKAAGVVIAPTPDFLPAVCTEIVELTEIGGATVVRPRRGRGAEHVRPARDDHRRIRADRLAARPVRRSRVAHRRRRLTTGHPAGGSARSREVGAEVLAARWNGADATRSSLSAAIGAEEEGPFTLDFDRHGPHGLIGGTTGSGKSELLKTIVAALAAGYPPDQLTFGLFDFKGGSTFTELAFLPHTVGTASDLDVNLARRALRCLRAELLRRELVFDQAGVADLTDFYERRKRGDAMALQAEPLPRLVVIIDEFAAMAKELSEEIGAIADLTARGRSLGVHLLLGNPEAVECRQRRDPHQHPAAHLAEGRGPPGLRRRGRHPGRRGNRPQGPRLLPGGPRGGAPDPVGAVDRSGRRRWDPRRGREPVPLRAVPASGDQLSRPRLGLPSCKSWWKQPAGRLFSAGCRHLAAPGPTRCPTRSA